MRWQSAQTWGIWVGVLRVAFVVIMVVAAAFYAVRSIHWPLMVDTPIMHYVNFLMAHGMKPYGQITDMNMPGSYLLDAVEMHVFGPGDLAMRFYCFFLGVVLTGAMIVITRPYDWLAGLYAGGFFVLLQGAEGPKLAGEREQVIATLLMVGYALLFTAVRRRQPGWAGLFGFLTGLTMTVKPTIGFLPLMLLVLLAVVLRRRGIAAGAYLGCALIGLAIAMGTSVVFLAHYHAFGSLLFVLRDVLPSYVAMKHPPYSQILAGVMPVTIFLLLPLAAIAMRTHTVAHGGWNWERWALTLGAAAGLLSYFLQNKGFLHHRYIFLCFLLLLIGLELTTALRRPGVARWAGAAGLAFTMLLVVPRYLRFIKTVPAKSDYTLQLERDLAGFGGSRLQGQVLCLDLVYGCLNSLYHLGLVENTGYTGDLLLFSPVDAPIVHYYRDNLMRLQAANPANLIVVSNEWLERPNTFARLDTWPAFEEWLGRNYSEVLEREFPLEGRLKPAAADDINPYPAAYRIYLRNGSALLDEARAARRP